MCANACDRQIDIGEINAPPMDATDRAITAATQGGLPRVSRPYHAIAQQLGLSPEAVMQRLNRMLQQGVIRRIGGGPHHYALGYRGAGMSVWDVADGGRGALGRAI